AWPVCLIPVVGVPPDFLNIKLDVAAEVYRCVFLSHPETLVVLAGLKGSAVLLHIFEAPLNHDEVLVDLRGRTPIPMILMARPSAWQPVARAELVNRAGFTVVACPDACFGALVERQRIVDGRDLTHHLRPSELVGNRLRQ